jgi:hypothetical protein
VAVGPGEEGDGVGAGHGAAFWLGLRAGRAVSVPDATYRHGLGRRGRVA